MPVSASSSVCDTIHQPRNVNGEFPSLKYRNLALVALTLAALALRLLALGSKSLLTDEGSSFYFAQLPLADLLWRLCDPHPPGYYLLLRALLSLGESEAWLRLPSALAGALTVPLTWALVQQLSGAEADGDRVGFLAAALLTVFPLHVWYSQEARPYALVALLALLMVLAGLRWRQQPTASRAALFLAAGWLALFTEYAGLVAWGGLNLFVLSGLVASQERSETTAASLRWRWIALQILLLLPFAVWWLSSTQRSVLSGPSYQAIFLAVRAHRLGLRLTPTVARRLLEGLAVAVATLALVAALVLRISQQARRWLRAPLIAILLIGVLLLLAGLGVVPRLYTVKRLLVVTTPYLSIGAAWAIMRLFAARARDAERLPWASYALSALFLLLSLITVLLVAKPPWREATAALAEVVEEGDGVWVDELDAPVFNYYWRDRQPWQPLYSANLNALNNEPSNRRIWLIATVTIYRNLHETLPLPFASQRMATRQLDWPGIAARAYEAAPDPHERPAPPITLIWGLDLPSPLATSCHNQDRP